MAKASCPSCGAPVDFSVPAVLVSVCTNCKSAVARTDRSVQNLGKVADLHDSASGLRLGLRGEIRKTGFTLLGCTRLKHLMGGTWTEWYACFDDGRWGWIAESQGRFQVTFTQDPAPPIPPLESLRAGEKTGGFKGFVVQEVGEAEVIAAGGQMPFAFVPGMRYGYADLSGPGGQYATFDYRGKQPALYLGSQVALDDLGFDKADLAETAQAVAPSAALNCPHCAAPLELRAPGAAERMTCAYCNSLIDCAQGKLTYLKTLEKPTREPFIPLGAKGTFDGASMAVIGFVVRSCKVEGERYYWEEYLLYAPSAGFRFLVRSEDHWILVRMLAAAEVSRGDDNVVQFNSESYTHSQHSYARVESVLGEFYWKVEIGEAAAISEWVNGKRVISREKAMYSNLDRLRMKNEAKEAANAGQPAKPDAEQGEVVWSFGEIIDPGVIEKEFGLKDIPRPSTAAPWDETAASSDGEAMIGCIIVLVIVGVIVLLVILDESSGGGGGGFFFGSFGGGGGK